MFVNKSSCFWFIVLYILYVQYMYIIVYILSVFFVFSFQLDESFVFFLSKGQFYLIFECACFLTGTLLNYDFSPWT